MIKPATPAQTSPRAFTLVELLVVIAIIGILVGMLLPAVQAARESARRSACLNNFKQHGLALSLFEETNKQYPEGSLWWRWTDNGAASEYKGSLLVRLLPYLEEQAVYDMYDFELETDNQIVPGSDAGDATGRRITELTIETFVCPSDEHPTRFDGRNPPPRAMHNYAGLKGPSRHINNGSCSCRTWDTWNSFALSSYESFEKPADYAGVFTRMSIATAIRHVTDGLSKTAFMGEVRPMCSAHASNGWAMSNNGQGLTSTIVPINYDSCSRERIRDGCARHCNWNTELGVKSSHPGGAHLLLGDGSVQFTSENIDMWAYQYLGAKADGEIAPDP